MSSLLNIFVSRPAQWATLEDLLDKLLFLAVSGDGMVFIVQLAGLPNMKPRPRLYHTLPAYVSQVCHSKKCASCDAKANASA
jgi:hypothetical protein